MPDVPYPITAENADDLKRQVWELIREIFEERIGGLNLGDVFVDSGGVLTLNLASSTPGLQKVSNALQVEIMVAGGLRATATGIAAKLKSGGGLGVDSSGLYISASGGADFGIIACPAGTSPVATIVGDTLTLVNGTGITITGNASARSVTIDSHARSHSLVGASDHTFPVAEKTDTYSATTSDHVLVCNKGTAMTINLPAATGTGRDLVIKNIGAGVVTVDGDGAETIDGETTQALSQWDSMTIVDKSAGNWVII